MAVACDITIGFGSAGNSLPFLGDGWAPSDARYTWGVGTESHLIFPRQNAADEYVLTLDVVPYVRRPQLPSQRLIVSVNDTVVGSTELSGPALLGYRIPNTLVQGSDRIVITLRHPDCARPTDFADIKDDRQLAFAVTEAKLHRVADHASGQINRLPVGLMLGADHVSGSVVVKDWATASTGLTLSELALRFESIGEDCEFGLFQTRCGADPLGLLRFSSTSMRNLIRGIDTGFDGIGAIEDIEVSLRGPTPQEYMIQEAKFGLFYHTWIYEGQRTASLMREQQPDRLIFLRRKFIEDLQSAEKIFVCKFKSGVSDAEILPLLMAINHRAGATLMWVVLAEGNRSPGTVEVVAPGLLKAYIDRFAPANVNEFSFDGWLRVCANACVLARLSLSATPQTAAETA